MPRRSILSQVFSRLAVRRPAGLCSLLAVLLCFAGQAFAASTTVVISQIYTAGGNSGASYNADYVELFNLSGANVSLNGYALQYMSAAGTSSVLITLPTGVTLVPGQRYLVSATPGATGAALPSTADYTASALAMGAAAGRIYLTSSATALAGTCPTANVVDFIGYGSTAACYEGSKYAVAPTTTLAIARTNQCVDTDQNSADFATVSPSPRNSSSTPTPCSGANVPPISSAAATPSSVNAGSATLLTATGTTGLSVTADLSAFSGFSTTQPLYDDGTNGDTTANDGTYSYKLTVPSSTAAKSYTLKFTGTNPSTLASSTVSTTLNVTLPVAFTPIHTIQGSTPGTSAYAGQNVLTRGIVTSTTNSGFYLQARDSDADSNPQTSEAIYVFAGSGKVPATATVGTEIEVTGTISLYPTTSTLPGTELDSPSNYTVLSTGNTLPAAITLTTSNPSPSGGILQLAYLQSMRVAVPSLTVTEPTDGILTETNETYTSTGQFWGEVTGLPRPTREPGLEVRDAFTASQPSSIARFDDDPETFLVDSLAGTTISNALNVTTGTVLNNVVGVMDLSSTAAVPRLIIDATTRPAMAGGGITASMLPAAGVGEVSIADQNMERFYNTIADTAGAVVVTPAAYQLRLAKASLGVRNVLNTPDIIAIEEMENLPTLTDLSNKISADAVAAGQPDPQYAPYLVQGNDPSGINVAFLVKPSKVNVLSVDQFGKTTTYTNPAGAQATLNDRPPLVLHAGVKRSSGVADYPVTVIVNHLRSLNGITDPSTGSTVRAKREQQAEYLANLVQSYQKAGEHVVVVGDFNAFDVNDGLVDSMGIIKGNPAPASQDVLAGPSGLVSPVLIDAAPTDVPNGAYSYVFSGYAQSIDHFLVTQDIASLIRTVPAHWNADFPVVYRNDATRPEASSDHDGIVGYLSVPSGQPQIAFTSNLVKLSNGSYQATIVVTNSGSGTAASTQITAAALGSANTTTALPASFGDVAAGTSASLVLNFPASAGNSGARVVEKITGTYAGGSFGGTLRAQLPQSSL